MQKKKKGAAAVLLSRCFFFLFIINFRLYGKTSCTSVTFATLAEDLAKQIPESDKLAQNIESILNYLTKQDSENLVNYFHPRLKTTPLSLRTLYSQEEKVLGDSIETSIGDIFLLQTKEQQEILCAQTNMVIYPHYGYEQQLAIIIQLLGKKDLGRLFFTLVPYQNDWKIGFVHFHKWTQNGKPYQEWLNQAAKENDPILTFLQLDLGLKLLEDNIHFYFPIERDLSAKKDAAAKFVEVTLSKQFSDITLHKVEALFWEDFGIGLTLSVDKKLSQNKESLDAKCKEIQNKLTNFSWFSSLSGLKCTFLKDPADKNTPVYSSTLPAKS